MRIRYKEGWKFKVFFRIVVWRIRLIFTSTFFPPRRNQMGLYPSIFYYLYLGSMSLCQPGLVLLQGNGTKNNEWKEILRGEKLLMKHFRLLLYIYNQNRKSATLAKLHLIIRIGRRDWFYNILFSIHFKHIFIHSYIF